MLLNLVYCRLTDNMGQSMCFSLIGMTDNPRGESGWCILAFKVTLFLGSP